jgi:uncharacterized protein (DUF983 family)
MTHAPHDPNEGLPLTFPGLRRTLTLFGRAFVLHCPNCGGHPVLRNWFKMQPACPRCGIAIERGEEDYWIGSMLFNLVLAEGLFALLFVGALLMTWPDVPWDAIQIAAPLGMIAAPLILFPFSKLVWLAFDLLLRPERAKAP